MIFLFRHVRDLPYFRGLLRAVESRFYQDLELQAPVYDLGCGDGHFASITFDKRIDVGLDPWRGPIREAGQRGAYGGLVQADAAHAPFPGGALCQRIQQLRAGTHSARAGRAE